MRNANTLKNEYLEILSSLDESYFDKNHPETKYNKEAGLSGLFLPSQPDQYFEAKNKIIGKSGLKINLKIKSAIENLREIIPEMSRDAESIDQETDKPEEEKD